MLLEKYMLCDEGFHNLFDEHGETRGFQFLMRSTYYRSVRLSLIEGLTVKVDGKEYRREQIRLTTREGTFSLDEMTTMPELYWEFGEKAVVTVLEQDGLGRGNNEPYRKLDVTLNLRVSYAFKGFSASVCKLVRQEC